MTTCKVVLGAAKLPKVDCSVVFQYLSAIFANFVRLSG